MATTPVEVKKKSPRKHRPITPIKFEEEVNSDDVFSPVKDPEAEPTAPPKAVDPFNRKKKGN